MDTKFTFIVARPRKGSSLFKVFLKIDFSDCEYKYATTFDAITESPYYNLKLSEANNFQNLLQYSLDKKLNKVNEKIIMDADISLQSDKLFENIINSNKNTKIYCTLTTKPAPSVLETHSFTLKFTNKTQARICYCQATINKQICKCKDRRLNDTREILEKIFQH